MHCFHFKNNQLYCENLAIKEIAQKIETPFYLYSQKTILENFHRLDSAFSGLDHLVCYALKANSNEALLSLLAERGAGADVVSGGELYLALKSGFEPKKIVYAGVGKRDDEIRYALQQKILSFNVESLEELRVINEIAKLLKTRAPVAIRLNPDIDIQGHPHISTGKSADKFGIDIAAARELFRTFRSFSNIELIGLHCHVGSQITDSAPYRQVVKILDNLTSELRALGNQLSYVDLGGGLGVRHEDVFRGLSAGDLDISQLIDELRPGLQKMTCKIIFEPGRALVAEAGVLVTKILYQKETHGKRFVIVDAAMNDLIRPSLYGAYHEIVPVQRGAGQPTQVDVVGPVCESGDFLGRDRCLPELKRGDLLAVMTAGAYGFTLSSNYNARPRPAEVLVDGANLRVIRERGKIENLWS
jgi:diaminopimelate decarboxylase